MRKIEFIHWIAYIACLTFFASCNKSKLLNEKPSTDIFIPTTLEDFRALLDKESDNNETPTLGELSADNFYLQYPYWQLITTKERNTYIWADDIYQGEGKVDDWNLPYKQVFNANVVLDGLTRLPMTSSNEKEWKAVKGAALFMRGYGFYNLAQVFSPLYDSATAESNNLGIPLRLTPDIETKSVRSTMKQTYDQLIGDLKEASALLPVLLEYNNRNRPCRPAAYAMLARVYLSMRAYGTAAIYADSCLRLYSTLIKYDTINAALQYPFDKLNQETLYQTRLLGSTNVLASTLFPDCIVDSILFRSYAVNDLRPRLFYITGPYGPTIKSSYSGSIYLFSGLAIDEVYLVRAECYARAGKTNAAMSDLNTLLRTRWKANTFIEYTADDPQQALSLILTERRKELAFRGLRWTDLRRLNQEGASITLTRNLNGTIYILRPGERKYVLPIPPDVIAITGMPQNPR